MMEVCKKTPQPQYTFNPHFPPEVCFDENIPRNQIGSNENLFLSCLKVRPSPANEILVSYPLPPAAYFIPPYQGFH